MKKSLIITSSVLVVILFAAYLSYQVFMPLLIVKHDGKPLKFSDYFMYGTGTGKIAVDAIPPDENAIFNSLPVNTIALSDGEKIKLQIKNKSKSDEVWYRYYDSQLKETSDGKTEMHSLPIPKQKGVYLLSIGVHWDTLRGNKGYRFFIKIEVV